MQFPDVTLRSNVQREIDPIVPEKGIFWIDAGLGQYRRVRIPAQNSAIAVGNMQCWSGTVTMFRRHRKKLWQVFARTPEGVVAGPDNVDVVEVPDSKQAITLILQNEEKEWHRKLHEVSGQAVEQVEEIGSGLFLVQNIELVSRQTTEKIDKTSIPFRDTANAAISEGELNQETFMSGKITQEVPVPTIVTRKIYAAAQQTLPHPERRYEEELQLVLGAIEQAKAENIVRVTVMNPTGNRTAVVLLTSHPSMFGNPLKENLLWEQAGAFQFMHLLKQMTAQSPMITEGIVEGSEVELPNETIQGLGSVRDPHCQEFLYQHPKIFVDFLRYLQQNGNEHYALFTHWMTYPHICCAHSQEGGKVLDSLIQKARAAESTLIEKYHFPKLSLQMRVFPEWQNESLYITLNGERHLADAIEVDCDAVLNMLFPGCLAILHQREIEQVRFVEEALENVVPIAWAGAFHEKGIVQECTAQGFRTLVLKTGPSECTTPDVRTDLCPMALALKSMVESVRCKCPRNN